MKGKSIEIMDPSILYKALDVAIFNHRGYKRKLCSIPAILHPLKVSKVIIEERFFDYNLIAAAILHDVLEDTKYTVNQFKSDFNDDVVNLVLFATEGEEKCNKHSLTKKQKIDSWKARKQCTIDKLKKASERELLLEFADKVSNLESLFFEYKQFGEDIWSNFNANKNDIKNYHMRMLKIFKKKLPDVKRLWRYEFFIKEIFKI